MGESQQPDKYKFINLYVLIRWEELGEFCQTELFVYTGAKLFGALVNKVVPECSRPLIKTMLGLRAKSCGKTVYT